MQIPLGDGFRCIGGSVQRLQPLIITDVNGMAAKVLDLASEPLLSDVSNVVPITMNFQFWHRDSMGSTNLTDGLSIDFQ